MAYSLLFAEQKSDDVLRMVVGWGGGSDTGLDKYSSSATLFSQIRLHFEIGSKFTVEKIRIPLDKNVGTDNAVSVTVLTDNSGMSHSLTTINSSNFSGKSTILYKRPELAVNGEQNLELRMEFNGTEAIGIRLPIDITVETFDDEITT